MGEKQQLEMGMKVRKGCVLWSYGEDTGVVGSQCYPGEKGTFWDTVRGGTGTLAVLYAPARLLMNRRVCTACLHGPVWRPHRSRVT